MLRFRGFLTEAKDNGEFSLNDAKGKAFEILFGSHLHHGTDAKGNAKKYLAHFRDENKNSPEQIISYIKSEMEKRHPGMYDEINKHAAAAAEHAREQLGKDGHTDIHDMAWTSQPSDHESFTGEKDPNSDADVMLKTNKGHIGISLKYGTQKNPNLRNPGLESIEALAGLKKGELSALNDQHQNRVKELGFTGTAEANHKAYKANKTSPAARAAVDSSLKTRREMAKRWQNGYAGMSSDQLRQRIIDLTAPPTTFQHYRLHTRPTASGVEHHMDTTENEVHNSLRDYAEFKALPHDGSAISVQILGRHHGSDKWHPVIKHGVKNSSGPMKGIAGTTKLFLKKPVAGTGRNFPEKRSEPKPRELNNTAPGGIPFHSPDDLKAMKL